MYCQCEQHPEHVQQGPRPRHRQPGRGPRGGRRGPGDGPARHREEEGAPGQEAGDPLTVRRGAQHQAAGPGGTLSQGIRGHGHDAEGGVRVSEEQVRGADHHHQGLC